MEFFTKATINNKTTEKILTVLYWISLVLTLIAIYRLFEHRLHFHFLLPEPYADENLFVRKFRYYMDNGWYASVSQESSPLFNFFSGIVFWFVQDDLLSLRWLNLISMVGMIILWSYFLINDLNLKNRKLVILSVVFLVHVGCMRNTYFVACNDSLFILFMSLGWVYLYRGITRVNKTWYLFAAVGLFFAAALSVRELLVLYVPALMVVVGLAYYKKLISLKYILIIIGAFIISVFCIHFPSLIERETLSIETKEQGEHTWAERKYLQVMLGRKGLVSWEEVAEYKKEHGANSLPRTYFQSMFMDPVLTVKTFFRLQYYTQLPFIRQLGLLYILISIIFLYQVVTRKLFEQTLWPVMIFYIGFSAMLCLMIVGMVEFRWYMVFTFALSVFAIKEFSNLFEKSPLFEICFYINLTCIAIANVLLIDVW